MKKATTIILMALALPASAQLSEHTQNYIQTYQQFIGSSDFLDQLTELESLIIDDGRRICKLQEPDCAAAIVPQSEEALAKAWSIMTTATPQFPAVPSANDPVPAHRAWLIASQNMWLATLDEPRLWRDQMIVTTRWCEQQIDLIGYMICLANIDNGLAIGKQLPPEFTQGRFRLDNIGLKTALLGEWAAMATVFTDTSQKLNAELEGQHGANELSHWLLDSDAVLNHHYQFLTQWYAVIDGEQATVTNSPCSECGEMGKIFTSIAGADYGKYIERHQQAQAVLQALTHTDVATLTYPLAVEMCSDFEGEVSEVTITLNSEITVLPCNAVMALKQK
ncbi:hypothetical protein [Salinibius halmophilus]|uniref:hypothetical protein n=1 Tax=Salinibius halmophilus TaxID=1853216 RepID=UPI000E67374E|nr:hypothetical protein [Salinibius halmophilus]